MDGGATLRDAGTYTAHIAFKGNYTSSLDGEVHPVIDPYTLRATASPLSREYDGTVTIKCSASWDNCAPFAGDDVAVKASGTMADASAGSGKTVAIALALEGAQSGNYVLAGTSLTGSVDIAKAAAPAIDWPTAGEITYGQKLADSVLSHTSDDNGAFEWKEPQFVPNAGEWAFTMVYAPIDTQNYAYEQNDLLHTVNIQVNKTAAPAIIWPSADSITYGQSLGESKLTSSDTHGMFAWENPNERPATGTHSYPVIYTPSDTDNYDYSSVTLKQDVSVTVLPADAPEILWPTASPITYGDKLSASVLTSADTNGTFAWKNPDEQPSAGTRNYVVVYTPNNASDYNYGEGMIEKSISVTVNKAQSVIDVSGVVTEYTYTGEMQIVNSGATLNHSECALVYSNNSFTTVAEGDGLTVKITAEETANYLAAEAEVTIHVARAEAPKLILPAASRLTYGQKLSESALSGSENAPGSFAWENGDMQLPAGVNSCNVVFTPDDPDNYAWTQEVLVQKIEVIVDQKSVSIIVGNASKTYGDADPKVEISVSGVLDGDSLDYSISRRSGEDAGEYAYSVKLGSNPNYRPEILPGTLTIQTRSIEDGSVSISAVSKQTYTGREIKPQPTLRFGGATLVRGTDYVLSYSNNVKPGRATITITGMGNFSGSCSVNFTIKEKAPAAAATATAAPAPSIAPSSNEALQEYLNDMGSLVFDAEYAPVDFLQIPVLASDEEQEGILLICASQEEGGEAVQRSLILDAAQLVKLQQALQENEIGDLIFKNGSAAARMNLAELTGGNMAKLMALILSGEEITDEILQSDWSAMEDAALTEAEYERFSLEVRIVPVVQEDGEQGFEISVWLCHGAMKLNVSDLIDSLCVMLDVSQLVTAENVDSFEGMYAIVQRCGEEIELLDSALVLAPAVSGDGNAEKSGTPTVIERYALTALYAGEGMYRVAARQAR